MCRHPACLASVLIKSRSLCGLCHDRTVAAQVAATSDRWMHQRHQNAYTAAGSTVNWRRKRRQMGRERETRVRAWPPQPHGVAVSSPRPSNASLAFLIEQSPWRLPSPTANHLLHAFKPRFPPQSAKHTSHSSYRHLGIAIALSAAASPQSRRFPQTSLGIMEYL